MNQMRQARMGAPPDVSVATVLLRVNLGMGLLRPTTLKGAPVRIMAKISKLKFFISSSMGETVPIELRTVLRTLSDRYELFEFLFIEEAATPANLEDNMRRMINRSDALIMVFHKLEGQAARQARAAASASGTVTPGAGLVKSGVQFEYQYAIDLGKPIFLFTQQKFIDHPPSRRYLETIWKQAAISSMNFGSSQECAAAIEQSVFNYIVTAAHEQLLQDGRKKLPSTAGGSPGNPNG